ncbi:MAG: carotenoid biosynthesis protein [Acidimicrobiia bacterium]
MSAARAQDAPRPGRRSTPIAAVVLAVVAAVATPLNERGGDARAVLAWGVIGGLAVLTTSIAARRHGRVRVGVALAATLAGTWLLERAASRTGVPFGDYAYSDALGALVDGVPAIVPLAWWAMALPARDAGAAVAALVVPSSPLAARVGRIVAGAAALTAWDAFLDPQMVGEGYWTWAGGGAYRDVPLGNYVGWFLTGIVLMAAYEALLPPRGGPSRALVAQYAAVAAFQTVGFAAFFDDALVAAVGGVAMGSISIAAAVGLARRRRAA